MDTPPALNPWNLLPDEKVIGIASFIISVDELPRDLARFAKVCVRFRAIADTLMNRWKIESFQQIMMEGGKWTWMAHELADLFIVKFNTRFWNDDELADWLLCQYDSFESGYANDSNDMLVFAPKGNYSFSFLLTC
jgi:hypothetical protein